MSLSEKDKAYMNGLNEPYWLRQGAKYAEQRDLFTCPKCKDDVPNPILFADE